MPTRLLITGASGFLGGAVVTEALRQGLAVRATSRRRVDANVAEWIPYDLEGTANGLQHLLEGIDVVVHVAGLAHRFGPTAPGAFQRTNAAATRTLVAEASRAGVAQFVLISSASVYGPHSGIITEETPCTPDTAYGRSKFAGELEALAVAADAKSIRLIILRPVTLYGPGDPGNVSRLMRAIDRGRFLWVGQGSNRKSLLHVTDAARAIVMTVQSRAAPAGVFNIGGAAVSMRQVVEALAHHLGRRVPRVRAPASGAHLIAAVARHLPLRAVQRMGSVLAKWLEDDVYEGRLFETTFGFRPQISVVDGLRDEVEWYRQTEAGEKTWRG